MGAAGDLEPVKCSGVIREIAGRFEDVGDVAVVVRRIHFPTNPGSAAQRISATMI
jgi:hypothetical protein